MEEIKIMEDPEIEDVENMKSINCHICEKIITAGSYIELINENGNKYIFCVKCLSEAFLENLDDLNKTRLEIIELKKNNEELMKDLEFYRKKIGGIREAYF